MRQYIARINARCSFSIPIEANSQKEAETIVKQELSDHRFVMIDDFEFQLQEIGSTSGYRSLSSLHQQAATSREQDSSYNPMRPPPEAGGYVRLVSGR
jgi:hypothetical protein